MGCGKMSENIPTCLRPGSGTLKYYKYWTPGLRPYKTKSAILKAIELKISVFRLDKIMNKTEEFNYKTMDFELVGDAQ